MARRLDPLVMEGIVRHSLRRAIDEGRNVGAHRYVRVGRIDWDAVADDVSRCLGFEGIDGRLVERQAGRAVVRFTDELLSLVGTHVTAGLGTSAHRPPPKRPSAKVPVARLRGGDAPSPAQHSADCKRVHEILVDALGELYGRGEISSPVEKSGRVDWTKLASLAGVSARRAESLASTYEKRTLQEIEDYVSSHRDSIERWMASRRLGLPASPPERRR